VARTTHLRCFLARRWRHAACRQRLRAGLGRRARGTTLRAPPCALPRVEEQDAWVRQRCAALRGGVGVGAGDALGDAFYSDHGSPPSETKFTGSAAQHAQRARRGGRRYWSAVCLAVRQYDGLAEGYRLRASQGEEERRAAPQGGGEGQEGAPVPRLSRRQLLFLHSSADLYDIIDWLDPGQRATWDAAMPAPGAAADDASRRAAGRLFSQVGQQGRPGWAAAGLHPPGAAAGGRRAPAGAAADAPRIARHPHEVPEVPARESRPQVALSGKCSALVRLSPGLEDLWAGHSTWDSYTAMLRLYKHYDLPLSGLSPAGEQAARCDLPLSGLSFTRQVGPAQRHKALPSPCLPACAPARPPTCPIPSHHLACAARRLSFSSYPGELFSDDDFFIADSGLVVLQARARKTAPSWGGFLFGRRLLHCGLWAGRPAGDGLAGGVVCVCVQCGGRPSCPHANRPALHLQPGSDPDPPLSCRRPTKSLMARFSTASRRTACSAGSACARPTGWPPAARCVPVRQGTPPCPSISLQVASCGSLPPPPPP
jgi:hypothetical protein